MTKNITPTGKFVWFDYVAKDPQKAHGFFGELFGWKTQSVPFPGGSYTMIAAGERTIAGYMPTPDGAPAQAHWISHLQVVDAAATSATITSLGGKVLKPAAKMGDYGTMAIVSDPHGGAFALWQPTKAEASPEPGDNQFVWNELFSQDPAASVAFYQAVGGFGEDKMEMPGYGTYHLLTSDGQPRAGVTKPMMPGVPHAWLPYVRVASADATTEKAKRLGANIVVPPMDVQGVGRFAILIDPQGASIGILQPPSA